MPHLLSSPDIEDDPLILNKRKVIDHLITHEDFLAYYDRMFPRVSNEEPHKAEMIYILREQTNGLFRAFNGLRNGHNYILGVFTKALQESVEDAMKEKKSVTDGGKELVRYLLISGGIEILRPTYEKVLEYEKLQGAESTKASSICTESHTLGAATTRPESISDKKDSDSEGAPTSWECTLM